MCTPDPDVNAWARQAVPSARRGVTLIELLVVISIMLLLMLMAIPMVRLMAARRPVREAARAVSDYFAAAQIRARETGRPAGVWIERFSNQPQSAFTLYQAEVPPPYGGTLVGATLSLAFDTTFSNSSGVFARFNVVTLDVDWNLIAPGDQLQLDYHGPWYSVETTSGSFPVNLDITDGTSVPWIGAGLSSPPLPFQFLRQPMRTAAKPLQLPGVTVIDLYASGTSEIGFEPQSNDPTPVIVMFSPNGGVGSVYWRDLTSTEFTSFVPTEPVHFLIGRRDRLLQDIADITKGYLAEDGRGNWEDLNNLWVSAFPRNGLVTVAENATATGGNSTDRATRHTAFDTARTYAKEGQSLGGR